MHRFAPLDTVVGAEATFVAVALIWIEGANTVEEAIEIGAEPHIQPFIIPLN